MWKPLSFSDWESIAHTRKQFHQAIQNVAAVGRQFLPYSKTDQNATLEWVNDYNRLACKWVKAGKTFRSSISFDEFEVLLEDENVDTIASRSLEGKTQAQVMVWLETEIAKLGLDIASLDLNFPYKIPAYNTAKGKPFSIQNDQSGPELGKYYHNAHYIFNIIKPAKCEINCWPHHFDMAYRITLLETDDPENSPQINVGFSPGDENISVPYFYVYSWPYITEPEKFNPERGNWNTDNWIGQVLPVSELLAEKNQKQACISFFNEAIAFFTEELGY